MKGLIEALTIFAKSKVTHDGGAGRRLCTWCGEREGAPLLKRK